MSVQAWESKLQSWVKPASHTEEDKRQRTERAIGDALRAAGLPPGLKTYAKGSYANNTNVRLDSDVDIAVEYTGLFYYDLSGDVDGHTGDSVGIVPATGPYSGDHGPADLKDAVERALVSAFGRSAVTRGNKALRVRETSRSLAADVVPCFTYREYWTRDEFRQGTKIFPDSGFPLLNWPKQHYDNGVAKNTRTGRRFKGMVRALKHLENAMVEQGTAAEVPSYLLECLAYNVADGGFGSPTLYQDFRSVLATIWNATMPGGDGDEWVEVNGIKYLFHSSQKWSREQAFSFAQSAWAYVGFEG